MDWKSKIIELIRKQILNEFATTNNFALPDHLAKKVRAYMSIREDLILCCKTVKELISLVEKGPQDQQQHILTAFWNSMIVIYAKCFTDASWAKKTKMEINNLISSDRSDLLDIHKKIMDTRHTFIAHRGDNENDQSIVFFSLPKEHDENLDNQTQYHIKSLRANNFGLENLKLCEELFTTVLGVVEKKLFSQLEKVHTHIQTSIEEKEIIKWLIK